MNVIITPDDLENMLKTMKVCEDKGYPLLHFLVKEGEISMVLKPIVIGTSEVE